MGAALANAVYWQGGLERAGWNVSLILIGIAAALAELDGPAIPSASLGFLRWPLLLLPAYAIFQIIPFPLGLVRMLSPARAALPNERLVSLSVNPAATWDHVLRLTAYALTFILARTTVCRIRPSTWLLVVPLLLIGGLEAAWGLTQAGGSGQLAVVHGSYLNRNHLAGLLEMVLPFAAMSAIAGARRANAKAVSISGALRVGIGTSLAAMISIALLRTSSRMGVISTAISAFSVAGLTMRRHAARGWYGWLWPMATLLIAFFTLIWLMPVALVQRFASLSAGDISLALRLRLWRESLPLLRDFPLFGCGLGGYASAVARYKDASLDFADYAHNDYLQYLIELGPVMWGLALFCAGLILVRLVRAVRRAPAGDLQFLGIAAAGSLLAMLVHSLADFNLYIPANALVFACIGGIAAGVTTPARQPPPRDGKQIHGGTLGSIIVPLAGGALAVCAAISTWGGFSR